MKHSIEIARLFVRTILLAALALTPLPGHGRSTTQQPEIAALVRRTLDAFARKDLSAVKADWSADSPDFNSFKVIFDISRVSEENIRFDNLRFTDWRIAADRASFRVTFDWSWRDGRKRESKRTAWNIEVIWEKSDWKWHRWDAPLSHLDTDLLALPAGEERRRLMRQEAARLTDEFFNAFLDNADHLVQYGKHAEASRYVEVACEMAEVLDDRRKRGRCFEARCQAFSARYQHQQALQACDSALQIYRRLPDRKAEWAALLKLGNARLYGGEYTQALSAFEAAYAICRELGPALKEAVTLKQVGVALQSLGRYGEALLKFEENRRRAAVIGDELAEASTLINLGNIYFLTGNRAEARAAYENAQRIFHELGDANAEAGARISLGNVLRVARDYEAATQQYELSLAIGTERQDRRLIQHSLSGLGQIYLLEGKRDLAEAKLSESLKVARANGDPEQQAGQLLLLGYLKFNAGRDDEALTLYHEASAIAAGIGDADLAFRCFNLIGDCHRRQKNWDNAAAAYRQAIAKIEFVRAETGAPFLQTTFLEQYVAPYGLLAECLYELNRPSEAFRASEQAKARVLVDLLKTGNVRLSNSMTMRERREEERLLGEINRLTAEVNRTPAAGPTDAAQRLASARESYQLFRDRLFLAHRNLQSARAQSAPVELATVGERLLCRQPGLRLLSYLTTRDKVFLFVLLPSGADCASTNLSVHELKGEGGGPLTSEQLREKVIAFRNASANPGGDNRKSAGELYERLLAPAEAALVGATHLVIIPDGDLLLLPFQALIGGGGRRLIEYCSLSYAPSATALVEMVGIGDARRRGRTSAAGLLAVGVRKLRTPPRYRDEELILAEPQARRIARLFGGEALTGARATETRVKSKLSGRRYLHLATHGEADSEAPFYSAVFLRKGARRRGAPCSRTDGFEFKGGVGGIGGVRNRAWPRSQRRGSARVVVGAFCRRRAEQRSFAVESPGSKRRFADGRILPAIEKVWDEQGCSIAASPNNTD